MTHQQSPPQNRAGIAVTRIESQGHEITHRESETDREELINSDH